MIANEHPGKAQTKPRAPIAKLPRGVAVFQTVNGAGREYWRVRLNKKFTDLQPVRRGGTPIPPVARMQSRIAD